MPRTWLRGRNEEFLGRAAKYAQRRKWAALLGACRTALAKVRAGAAVARGRVGLIEWLFAGARLRRCPGQGARDRRCSSCSHGCQERC